MPVRLSELNISDENLKKWLKSVHSLENELYQVYIPLGKEIIDIYEL